MLKNYFKVAFRNILRHKGFSFINISGLALGLAVFMLIMLWVQDENSYDRFHKNADRIYRLVGRAELGEQTFQAVVTPGEFTPYLQENIPEIEEASRFRPMDNEVLVKVGDTKFNERKLACADSSFFRIFDFNVITGNVEEALANVEKIILTESTARKYFGDKDPIGQTLDLFNGRLITTVSAIIEDLPPNTHFDFDLLISMKLLAPFDWGNHYFNGYFLLSENTDPNFVVEKINESIKEKDLGFDAHYYLQSIKDIHLKSNFDIDIANSTSEVNKNVYIFTFIAFFILLIACINFMNLSTARSSKRAREVGIRKVVGAHRKNLMYQFLGESILFAFLGMIFALVLIELLLPGFNQLTGKNLQLLAVGNSDLILKVLALTGITGIVAGFYPSIYLSSFKPILVMKGQSTHHSSMLRRILVIIQFALSVILICGAIVVSSQLKFIQTKNLGFDKENLIYMGTIRGFKQNYDKFRQEVISLPEIDNIALSSDIPTNTIHLWSGFEWEGMEDGKDYMLNVFTVDEHYLNTMKFNIIEGRAFSPEFADSSNYILNEAAVAYSGIEDPLGKKFSLNGIQGNIVGIVQDFNFKSIRTEVEPLVIRQGDYLQYMIARVQSSNIPESIEKIQSIWQENYPDYPFELHFMDADFEKLYEAEQRTGKVFKYFTILAILISCLGLFGLASFTAEQRTKEIGVRKVMGASVQQIVGLLSFEYLKWMFVANIIAWPLAWYVMNKWLQNFAYKIQINLTYFLLAGIVTCAIALITVSFQTIRAANSNPVKALNYE
jgi:putative ABC transport system permease protein